MSRCLLQKLDVLSGCSDLASEVKVLPRSFLSIVSISRITNISQAKRRTFCCLFASSTCPLACVGSSRGAPGSLADTIEGENRRRRNTSLRSGPGLVPAWALSQSRPSFPAHSSPSQPPKGATGAAALGEGVGAAVPPAAPSPAAPWPVVGPPPPGPAIPGAAVPPPAAAGDVPAAAAGGGAAAWTAWA